MAKDKAKVAKAQRVEAPERATSALAAFDPNAPGNTAGGMYGLPFTPQSARVVILPVPWEVTVSYGAGAACGPAAVWNASFQVDLYDEDMPEAWKAGIAMEDISQEWKKRNDKLRKKAKKALALTAQGQHPAHHAKLAAILHEVNQGSRALNTWVQQRSLAHLDAGQLVAVLGGDHSVPLGLMQALAEKHTDFAILHVDAHADLREAYEGFEHSHASIMFNALKIPQVQRLVQVGIRDYCDAEAQLIRASGERVQVFSSRKLARRRFGGETWQHICQSIISTLPQKVYISFDIDGLDPTLCPHTGTPVPGGLSFEEACFLVETVVSAGKQIIGCDLCEVAPGEDEWDGNVGARLLYQLCTLMAKSHAEETAHPE